MNDKVLRMKIILSFLGIIGLCAVVVGAYSGALMKELDPPQAELPRESYWEEVGTVGLSPYSRTFETDDGLYSVEVLKYERYGVIITVTTEEGTFSEGLYWYKEHGKISADYGNIRIKTHFIFSKNDHPLIGWVKIYQKK